MLTDWRPFDRDNNARVSKRLVPALVVILLMGLVPDLAAEPPVAHGLEAFLERVSRSFRLGHADSLASDLSDPEIVRFVREAETKGWTLRTDRGRVLRHEPRRSVVLVGGHPVIGNWGDETILARGFSGVYEARRSGDAWRLTRRLPLDEDNRILSHRLDVDLQPHRGLEVIDTMLVSVAADWGFAARLNHRAQLRRVDLGGSEIPHAFVGGVLWLDLPPADSLEVRIVYALNVAADSTGGANSGRFTATAGHVRNQYFWHPFFDFNSAADRSHFDVRVRTPSIYQATTSLPETSFVHDGLRTILARGRSRTFALTLMYDLGWNPRSRIVNGMKLQLYATQDFEPSFEALEDGFERTYWLLERRIGPPQTRYFAVAQGRARQGNGWFYRSNDLIVTGLSGGALAVSGPRPRAYFHHELAHAWMAPTGDGTNFLLEGWATFVESLALESEFGPEAAEAFWEWQRCQYETGGFDGTASLLDDPHNSGIAYSKGAWVFRSLREVLGDAFFAAMSEYVAIPFGERAGAGELASAFARRAEFDLEAFMSAWLREARIPDVEARIDGRRLTLRHHGALFSLPLEIELRGRADTSRIAVHFADRSKTIDLDRDYESVHVDPDHHFLMKRRMGETVRFEHRAPGAKDVVLVADFAPDGLWAERIGDVWTLTVPLSEGLYNYRWYVDDEPEVRDDGGVRWRTVRVGPVAQLETSYPRVPR